MNSPMPPPLPSLAQIPSPAAPVYRAPPARPTCTTAVVSLIAGLLGWLMLPLIGPIVAIITGHMARGEIRRSNGSLDGDGLAIAGLILGYLQIALIAILVLIVVIFLGGLAAVIAAAQ